MHKLSVPGCLFSLALLATALHSQSIGDGEVWLTKADRSSLLAEQPQKLRFTRSNAGPLVIDVNRTKTYQAVDGFGFALTGGSAQLMMQMDAASRSALIKELFSRGESGIGVSYLRVSIGSSDMNDHVFTYDDLPPGAKDEKLLKFDLAQDRKDVIPVLKEILAVDSKIKILASPWTAPSWMKTNDNPKDGHLKPEDFPVYAQYLVRYIEAMKDQGIRIDAITVQNEPLNGKNTPSMVMAAEEEGRFIIEALGPALRKAGLATKVILYDHNCDVPDYPLSILKDNKAAQFVDGSGFHLYGGEIEAMSQVHEAFPEKNVYFTEQMVVEREHDPLLKVAEPESRVLIGAMRNWSRNVLLWNLAADPNYGPHTGNGGCPVCQGAITLDGSKVTRNIAYYTIAHAAKFVPQGSIRIGTNLPEGIANVAFLTTEGKVVLIVANNRPIAVQISVRDGGRTALTTLDSGSVATYVW